LEPTFIFIAYLSSQLLVFAIETEGFQRALHFNQAIPSTAHHGDPI
jgi:hypothetical protein